MQGEGIGPRVGRGSVRPPPSGWPSGHASWLRSFLGRVVRGWASGNPASFFFLTFSPSFIYFAVAAFRGQINSRCPIKGHAPLGGAAKIKKQKQKLPPYPPHVQRTGVKQDERKVLPMTSESVARHGRLGAGPTRSDGTRDAGPRLTRGASRAARWKL